jgi:hypothetical protein
MAEAVFGVIAGDHLHADAGGVADRHRFHRLPPRRVDQAEEAEEDEVALGVGLGELGDPVDVLARGGEEALAAGRDPVGPVLPARGVDRDGLAVAALVGAHGEQALGRALEEDHVAARMVVVERRHVLPLGGEGDGVEPRQIARLVVGIEVGLAAEDDQSGLHRVAFRDPVVAVAPDGGVVAEHPDAQDLAQVIPVGGLEAAAVGAEAALGGVADPLDLDHVVGEADGAHGHLVAGQRAGLVGADRRDRAQRLDGRQAADDGVAPCHALDPDGEGDGHHRGEALGDGGDRDGDGGEEHLAPVAGPDDDADGEGQGGKAEDREAQRLRERVEALHQRRLELLDVGEHAADPADLGGVAGAHDDAGAVAGGDEGAGIGEAGAVADRGVRVHRADGLRDGGRLAGKGGLLGLEVADADEADVGGDAVAGVEEDDVAGDEVGRPRCGGACRRAGPRRRGEDGANALEGALGATLLDEADDGDDEDDAEDHAAVEPFAEGPGDDPGGEQEVDEEVVELGEETGERRAFGAGGQAVRAEGVPPAGGLVVAEAVLGLGGERGGGLVGRDRVPGAVDRRASG